MYYFLMSAIRNTIPGGLSTQGTVVVWLLSGTSVVHSLAGAGAGWEGLSRGAGVSSSQGGTGRGAGVQSRLGG